MGAVDEHEVGVDNEQYEIVLFPNNAAENSKSGVTIKGSSEEYVVAHTKVIEMLSKRETDM